MKFYHIVWPDKEMGNGVLTLAVQDDHSAFGWAFCNPGDQFSKRKGRTIAEGRLKKKPLSPTPSLKFGWFGGIFLTLEQTKHWPEWAPQFSEPYVRLNLLYRGTGKRVW